MKINFKKNCGQLVILILIVVLSMTFSNKIKKKVKRNTLSATGMKKLLAILKSGSSFVNLSPENYINRVQEMTPRTPIEFFSRDGGVKNTSTIILSAYYRLKAFMDASGGLANDAYILNVQIKPQRGGVSKILFGVTFGALNGSGGGAEPTPLVKACVPSDIGIPSYLSFNCVFNDCPKTLKENDECKNEGGNVPVDSVKYIADF